MVASPANRSDAMKQPIIGYHQDQEGHWVAELVCGHFQHVRHDPPWMHREWVTTLEGRELMIGLELGCKKCDENAPKDWNATYPSSTGAASS
jgi:hypothetical protein